MAFIEQEAKAEYKEINGKRVLVITPECEVTLKNLETGQEYNSDKEAEDDIADPNTDTVYEDVTRSVKIKVADMPPLGAGSDE